MISPTKYTNPDKSIINLSITLIKVLLKKHIVKYDELQNLAIKEDLKYLFIPTLNLLFSLGIISYKKQNDIFVYEGVK
jgi:hypothetical protein